MTPVELLFSQGFGTRRECRAIVLAGRLGMEGSVVDDPETTLEPTEGGLFRVDETDWPYHRRAVVMLHKPAGTECSAKPQAHPSVLSLLPQALRRRGVQPVGRLDADTTGLLLLTDDGALNHRLTSPRQHVPKVYEVGCVHAVTATLAQRLLAGVELRDAPGAPARALACEITGERSLRLIIDEGRYHQVKRMLAAAGNRVQHLHRSRIGALELPGELAAGAWAWIDPSRIEPGIDPSR